MNSTSSNCISQINSKRNKNTTIPKYCHFSNCKIFISSWSSDSDTKYIIVNILALKLYDDQIANMNSFKVISTNSMYLKSKCVTQENEYKKTTNCNKNQMSNSFTLSKNELRSRHYREFLGCGLIVCSVTDGFLYFLDKNKKNDFEQAKLLELYSFTSSIKDAILGDYLLFAITGAGLEVYNSKVGHHLLSSLMEESSDVVVIWFFETQEYVSRFYYYDLYFLAYRLLNKRD